MNADILIKQLLEVYYPEVDEESTQNLNLGYETPAGRKFGVRGQRTKDDSGNVVNQGLGVKYGGPTGHKFSLDFSHNTGGASPTSLPAPNPAPTPAPTPTSTPTPAPKPKPAPPPKPTPAPSTPEPKLRDSVEPEDGEYQFVPMTLNRLNVPSPSGLPLEKSSDGKRLRWRSKKETTKLIDSDGRKTVLLKVGDTHLPFYLSTGDNPKEGVAPGKWYPTMGLSDSWYNKGGHKEIADYYGHPELRRMSEFLDKHIGDIRHDALKAGGRTTDPILPNDQEHEDIKSTYDHINHAFGGVAGISRTAGGPQVAEVLKKNRARLLALADQAQAEREARSKKKKKK